MFMRINLLPVKYSKKRELGLQTIVLFALVLVAALVGNFMWYSNRDGDRARIASTVNDTKRRISDLDNIIKEVGNINKRKKEVEDKLKVLGDLRKGRSGPVRMMDAFATAVPKKVWITSFDEKSNTVVISGEASSHEDVAEFMRALATTVWTPKGIARVVEKKRGAQTSRVSVGDSGIQEDFLNTEVGNFFTNIDLKKTANSGTDGKRVTFQISMNASYTI